MARDYYEILGVAKAATQDEIKKAYRKLAHKHHPDKGGDQERFKEVSEAYQVLSNEQKRAKYDQFGSAGADGGFEGFQGSGNEGFEDIFKNYGGNTQGFKFSFGGGGFGDIFGDMFESAMANTQADIEIPLSTSLLGGKIKVTTSQNETIELRIPEGTRTGTTFAVKGKGGQTRRGRGDLHLTVHVRFPRKLTKEQRRLIEEMRLTGL